MHSFIAPSRDEREGASLSEICFRAGAAHPTKKEQIAAAPKTGCRPAAKKFFHGFVLLKNLSCLYYITNGRNLKPTDGGRFYFIYVHLRALSMRPFPNEDMPHVAAREAAVPIQLFRSRGIFYLPGHRGKTRSAPHSFQQLVYDKMPVSAPAALGQNLNPFQSRFTRLSVEIADSAADNPARFSLFQQNP